MKVLKILLTLLLVSGLANAGVNWYGYFESQADGQFLKRNPSCMGTTNSGWILKPIPERMSGSE